MEKKIDNSEVLKFIVVTIGSVIMAASMNPFLVPNKIAPGGVSGAATIIYHIADIPVGMIIFGANIPLFLLSLRRFGKKFSFMTLYCSVLVSVLVDYVPTPVLTDDPMLASVAGGVVMGVGLGLIERCGGNTGGSYLAAKLLQQHVPFISVPWVMFGIDSIVVIASGVVFSAEIAMFSMVALYVSTKVMELVMVGVTTAREVNIITDNWDCISQRIISEMERGVTKLAATGMYSGNEKGYLVCVLESGRELMTLKKIVKEEDPAAFVIVKTSGEVLGEGFRPHE